MRYLRNLAALAFGLAVLAGCEGGTDPAPVPTTLEYADGTGQTGVPRQRLADSLAVRVLDQNGDPSPGTIVDFAVTGGGGSVSPAQVVTGPDGYARAAWTLGPPGPQTAEARAPALGDAVAFTASAVSPPPAQVVKEGDGKTGVVGKEQLPLAVVVRDAAGNPVEGVLVTWTTTQGQLQAVNYTGPDGRATALWRLGFVAGTQTVTANVQGFGPVTFTATATHDEPWFIRKVAGDLQPAVYDQPLPDSLVVRVTDFWGNGVPGIQTHWFIVPNEAGGSISPAQSVTDAGGFARARWTTGNKVRRVRVFANIPGEKEAFFTVAAQPGAPDRLVAVSGTAFFTPDPGVTLPDTLQVRVLDARDVPVPGATVTWQVTAGGGSADPPASAADTGGVARTRWTIGPNRTANRLIAFAAGTDTIAFLATTSGPVFAVYVTPSPATVNVGGTVQLTARPVDIRNKDLSGRTVTWSTSNPGVATVSQSGLVTGVAPGTAVITAESEGKQGTSNVTVNP